MKRRQCRRYIIQVLTRKGAYAVVDACNKKSPLPGDSQRLVHDCLVVANDVDPGKLGEDLHKSREHEPAPPLGHLEHGRPPRHREGLFGVDGRLDLVELVVNPFVVVAVIVQPAYDRLGLLELVGGDEVARRLGEPEHAKGEERGRKGLKRQREAPLEGRGGGHVGAAVANPRRHNEADANHLLG